ncbi:MAG: reverse transcriptase domain-containing protein [Alkalispirochaeta sp.]
MAGIPESTVGGYGGNPESSAGGVSNVTATEEHSRPETEHLMEAVVERENMVAAYKRIVSNRGSAGIDEMSVEDLAAHLREHWPGIKKQLLQGTYEPQPVRGVEIPKPGKKGTRRLGIPTVVDRLIEQAMLQVLHPVFDPGFSESSYGFRPGRSAHQAVLKEREHAQAGVMEQGLVSPRREGTPQGGPLSPLLSNIMLDDLDKELERRGHRFCRYADDSNFYVQSQRAGKRVLASITEFLTKRLKGKLRQIFRMARGWSMARTTEHLKPILRGWGNYLKLSEVKAAFEQLKQWLR